MAIRTWTRKDWDGFDELCIDGNKFEADRSDVPEEPIEVDDEEGDPMGLSDVDEDTMTGPDHHEWRRERAKT